MTLPISVDPLLLFFVGGVMIFAGVVWLQEEFASRHSLYDLRASGRPWVLIAAALSVAGACMIYQAYALLRLHR